MCVWLFKKGEGGGWERDPWSCFVHPPVSWWLDRRGVARRILCLGCCKSPGTISNRARRLPFIIATGPSNRVSNLWRNGASAFTKGFPKPPTWTLGTYPRAGCWSWTIWWRRMATTNGCWICLPNTRIIVTSPSCICVKICSPRASMPKPFRVMPITSWPSRIRAINWGLAIWWCKRFPRIGATPSACTKRWRNLRMGTWCWICIRPLTIATVCLPTS